MPKNWLQENVALSSTKKIFINIRLGNFTAISEDYNKEPLIINEEEIDGTSLLHHAAFYGRMEIMKWLLLKSDKNISKKDDKGMTPLLYAAASGHRIMVQYLISKGATFAEKDNLGLNALHYAASSTNLLLVKWLWQLIDGENRSERSNDGYSALHCAADAGNLTLIQWLLEDGKVNILETDNNGATALDHAIGAGHSEVVLWLKNNKKRSPESEDLAQQASKKQNCRYAHFQPAEEKVSASTASRISDIPHHYVNEVRWDPNGGFWSDTTCSIS